MKTLKLGRDFEMPAEKALTETFALLAVRGAGKSNAARVMAEEFFKASLPFVAIDPVGSWRGLRAARDGKGKGLSIPIFGGKWGDVPLERGGGDLIADLVVDQRLACVLDLSTFESESAKKQFLLAFARRLYAKNEKPLHLFLEEADDYIPQKPHRDEFELLRAWENIVRRGRAKCGIGCTLISQRSAVVAKDVLTQCQTLIALRSTAPQDIAAIGLWLKYHAAGAEILSELAGLRAGEAWVWSPAFLGTTTKIRFRESETFDSGATPKMGAGPAATLADVDLGQIRDRMAATIERAKASDPKHLAARVRELERQLENKEHSVKAALSLPAKPALSTKDMRRFEAAVSRYESAGEKLDVARDKLAQAQQTVIAEGALLRKALHAAIGMPELPRGKTRVEVVPPRALVPYVPPRKPAANGNLSRPEQKILDALAEMAAIGYQPALRPQLAVWCGYTNPRSGGFTEPLGALAAGGFVLAQAGGVELTEAGAMVAAPPQITVTNEAVQERILSKLERPEQKLLRRLLELYPGTVERPALAEACGYTNPRSGGFTEPLGRLTTLGLVTSEGPGLVRAAHTLFPGGI